MVYDIRINHNQYNYIQGEFEMATLATAKEKYAYKMSKAGPVWKSGVTDKSDEYSKGVSDFIGRPTNPAKVEAWRAGTDRITAEKFAEAVRGKEDKWARRLVEAMGA